MSHIRSIVDLEEALTLDLHEILSRDAPAEIGMVDVREHGLPRLTTLLQHGIDPALHHIQHIGSAPGRDLLAEIGGIDVNRKRQVPAGDLLGRNHQEPTGLFEPGAKLFQRLQPILVGSLSIPPLQPVGTEAALVLREGFGKMVLRGLGDPLLTLEHPVVVRHRQEVVAVLLVPVGDGLRKIVAIAPQGVGVQIAFPPAGLSGREFLKPTRTCDEGPKAKT